MSAGLIHRQSCGWPRFACDCSKVDDETRAVAVAAGLETCADLKVVEQAVEKLEQAPDTLPYKVICISLYRADLDRMDALVAELKQRGYRKANRSWLIRYALARVDADAIAAGGGSR